MMRALFVKCSIGRRANGSWTLWSTFNQLFIESNWLLASHATTIVGAMAIDRVTRTRRHFDQLILRKPYSEK